MDASTVWVLSCNRLHHHASTWPFRRYENECHAWSYNVVWSPFSQVKTKTLREPKRHQTQTPVRKYNVASLRSDSTCQMLEEKLEATLDGVTDTYSRCSVEIIWFSLKSAIQQAATEAIGFVNRKHQEWFDENDDRIQPLLKSMHALHLAWISDKGPCANKACYKQVKQQVQASLCQMKEELWNKKAKDNRSQRLYEFLQRTQNCLLSQVQRCNFIPKCWRVISINR